MYNCTGIYHVLFYIQSDASGKVTPSKHADASGKVTPSKHADDVKEDIKQDEVFDFDVYIYTSLLWLSGRAVGNCGSECHFPAVMTCTVAC